MKVHASSRVELQPGKQTVTAHSELLRLVLRDSSVSWEVVGTADSEAVTTTLSAPETTAQQTPANRERTAPPGPQAIPDSKVEMTFALKLVSDGILCPRENLNCADQNILWKSFSLLASDGHMLFLTSIPFPSGERSREHFESSIKGAEKMLRRTIESNSKGEQVGERALGLFSEIKDMKPPSGVPHYQLFWTWGPNYWVVNGEHLEDVLALEEKLKSEGVNVVWTWHSTKRPSTPD